jgi:hypothetical protein
VIFLNSRISLPEESEGSTGPVAAAIAHGQWHDAHVLAREYGFRSWAALKAHVESLAHNYRFERYTPEPGARASLVTRGRRSSPSTSCSAWRAAAT